ncbi:MAG: hypothetical protein HC912_05835, partial [Saprospiraceae bacterium]|nr:hypothetical protein [Saprospiraceae bacterium]
MSNFPYRVEYTITAGADYMPAPQGANNGTSVQIATASTCTLDFGVLNNTTFCSNPQIVTNCYDRFGLTTPQDVLVSIDFQAPSTINHESQNSQIGATYGLAYQQSSKTMFAAAFMKRFSPFGPNGPGAIYQI